MEKWRVGIAKISRPCLFGVAVRHRLFDLLDDNRGRPLIWIEGPPGAGKTTLIASFIEERAIPSLWYQVDEADADPGLSFQYLSFAVHRWFAADGVDLPTLQPEHFHDIAAFARAYFRKLFAYLPDSAIVVFDNFQLGGGEYIECIVEAASSTAPPGVSVVAISRAACPARFAPVLARGAQFSLTWEALRLTLDETRVISSACGIHGDALVRALHEKSEGWAAGVTLMLERLKDAELGSQELPTDTQESVFDYFASQIFEDASPEDRATLISLAYLPHIDRGLACRLVERDDAGELLERLYRRRLFTHRRPNTSGEYEFHSLFKAFLQRRAHMVLGARGVQALILRSADELESAGDIEGAIELRIVAGDRTTAQRMVIGAAASLLDAGRRHTLERWALALDTGPATLEPRLLYWLGVAQTQSAPETGLQTLSLALHALRDSDDLVGRAMCLAAMIHASLTGVIALERASSWLEELLQLMSVTEERAAQDAELSVWSAIAVGLLYLRPWDMQVISARRRAQEILRREVEPTAGLAAASTVLLGDTESGNLDMAEELVSLMEPLAHRREASPSAKAWFLFAAAYVRFLRTSYDETLRYIDAACDIASASGLNDTLSDISLCRVMVEYRIRGWVVANVTLQRAESRPYPRRLYSLALLRNYQARRAQFAAEWDSAAEFAIASQQAIVELGAAQFLMQFGLFNGEILVGAGRFDLAAHMIGISRSLLANSPVMACWQPACLLGEAFLALRRGERDQCLDLLSSALEAAQNGSGKYYLRYMECSMPSTFALALREGIQVAFVQRMIRIFRLKAPYDAPDLWPRPVQIQTLGRFEVRLYDKPLEFSRKLPKKTLALLKALVSYRGERVPEQWLCDALWNDEEADAARQVLGVTVGRLRKLLGFDEAVMQQGGKVWLDRQAVSVDAWQFERSVEAQSSASVPEALRLYGGAFLPEDDGEVWSVPARERIRGKFIHAVATYGHLLEADEKLDEAVRLYLLGIDADVIVERFYCGLMRCYQKMGRPSEALSVFRRLRHTLAAVLATKPSPEAEALYQSALRASEVAMPNGVPPTSSEAK